MSLLKDTPLRMISDPAILMNTTMANIEMCFKIYKRISPSLGVTVAVASLNLRHGWFSYLQRRG